jgi:hypothetical protein
MVQMKKKSISDYVKIMNIDTPENMEYHVNIETGKDRQKFIEQIKKIIRGSTEYRDYIQFLKDHMDLNKCTFFQNINGEKTTHGKVSIELHHEPFTLQDYVDVVIEKYLDNGTELNALLIADEVLELHYENKVGLVPLSKTMHEVVHNSNKILIPLNMVYGEYSKFLEEYEPYISDELYDKLQKKIDMTKNLTADSFDAIRKEFTYIDVKGFDDVTKLENTNSQAV